MAFLLILTNILSRVYVVCHTLVRPERCYHQRNMYWEVKDLTWRGSLRGFSVGLLGGMMESRASSRVMPLALPSFLSTFQPWRIRCCKADK